MRAAPSQAFRWFVRLLACLGFVLVAATLVPPRLYGGFLAGPWTEPQGNVLVVLGSDTLDDGSLGETSFWRCVFAVDVWRQSEFRYIVVSGDAVTTSAMQDYLLYRGIPREAIVRETGSSSTRQNAINTARLAGGMTGPFVLLTSDFHMWRASRAFAKAGLTIAPRACPDAFKRAGDWRNRWQIFQLLMEEFVKIGYYRLHGWI